jgi:hypothetical protein
MKLLSRILNMVFPEKCPFCGKLLKDGEFRLCEKCLRELPYTGGRTKNQRRVLQRLRIAALLQRTCQKGRIEI